MRWAHTLVGWTPRTPVFYGWVVLGMICLGTYAATGVAQVVFGGIQNLIYEDMGWDRKTVAFAVTAGTWGSGLLTPFVGRLADRHGPRAIMPVGVIVVGVCFFALAGIGEIWHFYAAYMVARTVANPTLVGVVPRTVTVNFFLRKRNLALGLVSTFRPVGGAINVQIISEIAALYSWRMAYRILGIFSLLLAVPLFLIMRRRPEDIGLAPDGDERPNPVSTTPKEGDAQPARASAAEERDWTAGEALASSAFWFIISAEMLTILTSGTVGYQIVPFLVDSGLSQRVAAISLGLSSSLGALVNPGWGLLADRYQPRLLAAIATLLAMVAVGLFIGSGGGIVGCVFAVVWGIASGGLNVLGSMMIAQYFGRANFGTIIGIAGPFQMVFLGLGPSFGALLFDFTGGYASLAFYSVGAYVVAAFLIFSARRPTPKEERA